MHKLAHFHDFSLYWLYSLSKTTKLILLDSLLQEVCIRSGLDGLLRLSACLSQSETYFFRAEDSPLKHWMIYGDPLVL